MRGDAFRVTWSDRSSRIRHRNALTERAWKDAVQGLGNAHSHATHKTPEAYKGKSPYCTSLTSDSTSTATIFFAFISSFLGFNI